MAEAPRRSKREFKVKKDNIFVYDQEVLDAIAGLPIAGRTSLANTPASETATVKCFSAKSFTEYSELEIVPLAGNSSESANISVERLIVHSEVSIEEIQILSPHNLRFAQRASRRASVSEVNTAGDDRRKSSTRVDFLNFQDIEGNFLSAESSNTMSSSESTSENVAVTAETNLVGTAGGSKSSSAEQAPADLTSAVITMMDAVTKKLSSFEQILISQNNRLESLEATSIQGSSSEPERRGSAQKGPGKRKNKSKSKVGRVEFEKDRALKVTLEQLLNRCKNTESESEEDPAEEVSDLKGLKSSMSKKKKEEVRLRLASRLNQAGSTFPVEDSDPSTTSGSGNESDIKTSSKSRRKVKSGAKVKRRPVVKTELWPQTIANEEDGDEVTSEDIGLAKFLSCFTFIMATCEGKEVTGRPLLLHAVMSVLDCLPWSEARTFHNLVMVKLEQGRIRWSADFSDLADQFLQKKLRQSLRTKVQSTSTTAGYRAGYRGSGTGSGGSNYRSNVGTNFISNGGNQAVNNSFCRQWNEGSCTYGAKCKRWHVCRACGEAGKLGEPHKSSSPGCPNSRRRSEQRT